MPTTNYGALPQGHLVARNQGIQFGNATNAPSSTMQQSNTVSIRENAASILIPWEGMFICRKQLRPCF